MPIDKTKCCSTHSNKKEDNGECCQTQEKAEQDTYEYKAKIGPEPKEINE